MSMQDEVRSQFGPSAPAGGLNASGLVYHTKLHPSPSAVFLADHVQRQGDSAVEGVQLCRRDAVVFKRTRVVSKRARKPKGAIIKGSSARSLRNFLFLARNCDCDFLSMITLTYPGQFSSDGRRVKKHLEAFREDYLKRYQRRGLWWLEFQMRGAPHFHILSEVDLRECGDLVLKRRRRKDYDASYSTCQVEEDWISRRWFEIVGSGDERHLRAGCSWEVVEKNEGALRYAASHAAKSKQKQVPEGYQNVGRFWGKIGAIKIQIIGRVAVDSTDVFQACGYEAMSSRGRIKKHLYDASLKFSLDDL